MSSKLNKSIYQNNLKLNAAKEVLGAGKLTLKQRTFLLIRLRVYRDVADNLNTIKYKWYRPPM